MSRFGISQLLFNRFGTHCIGMVSQILKSQLATSDVGTGKFSNRFGRSGKIQTRMRFSFVNDPPDSPTGAIPPRMIQRHFVVANDAIVKIRHIQCSVRSQLNIHGPKPGVAGFEKIRFLFPHRAAAMPGDAVLIDPGSHDIANEEIAQVFFRPKVIFVHDNATDRRRTMSVLNHGWSIPQTIMRLAKTGIVTLPNQLINR